VNAPQPSPPLPPLVAEDFRDPCGHPHRGIAIVETEDGDMFAFGHHAAAQFAVAANEHMHELIGRIDEDDQVHTEDIGHRWAVTTVEPGEFGEWIIDWRDGITEQTPGAFPITRVNR
jgi:hypothetical protein